MKIKEYFKELSLTILGVLIALLIDNYRESVRDEKVIRSYLEIVVEDLGIDILKINQQLKWDSAYARDLKILSDVLTYNADLPQLKFSLASWTKQDQVPYRKLSEWDSLDYYTRSLYTNTEYKLRKIGFSTIVNSGLSHRIERDLLKEMTVYYTTESDFLDFIADVDDRCHWLGIEYLNQYQGSFKDVILQKGFDATQIRNEASGRYSTTLREMKAKQNVLEKAKTLLANIQAY